MGEKPQCSKMLIKTNSGEGIYARTPNQRALVDAIENNDIIFADGIAGSGKTYIATVMAIAGLECDKFSKLILTRPAVEAGESLGFLPGDLDDKIGPYMQPIHDILGQIRGRRVMSDKEVDFSVNPAQYKGKPKALKLAIETNRLAAAAHKKAMMDQTPRLPANLEGRIEVRPLAYMRGSTFTNAFIILDEAANVTKKQMEMILTRLGEGSKIVICGDTRQSDLKAGQSGYADALERLEGIEGIARVTLGLEDIQRHGLVREILIAYNS